MSHYLRFHLQARIKNNRQGKCQELFIFDTRDQSSELVIDSVISPLCFINPNVVLFTEKQEKEVDIYAGLSDEKAFVFSVALAEINRKILGQRLIL